ncbi:DUF2076 domain-containing protein [Kutzneria sp. CA-103260]|uniref:DUF2076 domain-containing protein n=1 Tax=Kutzneria sp. CA-103260 TaxID=2802641 RepID=UPI001BA57051|nr:DUF2076 family protein [Kutzneria sp. CA-103260]QUQ65704.1 hypothetical protein JJ691_34280 [Kutzneria sp. CA-103260]
MESNDQQLILGLAERLRQAQPVQKDPQPAELIARHIASQPDAVYLLTQAVLVQEDALRAAQAQIADLNARLAPQPQPGGGFLAGMFGRGQAPAPNSAPAPASAPAPYAAPAEAQPARSGGSFLKTAAAAAAGVAGGGLLLQGLTGAFSGHQEAAPSPTQLADAEWEEESDQW